MSFELDRKDARPPADVLNLREPMLNQTVDESDIRFHYVLYNIIAPTVFCLIIVIGVIDNACVVAVVTLHRKMRTAVNLLLLNLAFGDLAFLTTGVPFVVYHYAADAWKMGDLICRLSHYALDVTGYVTVYTLVTIAAVRFIKLVYSDTDLARGINRSVMMVVIIGLWAAALATNWPVLWFYSLKEYKNMTHATYIYCGVETVDVGRRLFIVYFVLAYILPLAVTCIFYCLIMRHLRKRWRESSIYHRPSGTSLASTTTSEHFIKTFHSCMLT